MVFLLKKAEENFDLAKILLAWKSDFNGVDYRCIVNGISNYEAVNLLEKTICHTADKYTGTQEGFLDKVIPDIDGFADEPVAHQCDVQVVQNTLTDDAR